MKRPRTVGILFNTILICFTSLSVQAGNEVLAHWNFDQIKHLRGDSTSLPELGKPLTASDRGPAEPMPYIQDLSGKGNYIQVRGARPSSLVFSDNLPFKQRNGIANNRSLALKKGEYVVTTDRSLAFYDLQKSWVIEASLQCILPGTEQVYLCKEGPKGALTGDLSIGYDNMLKTFFVEVVDENSVPRRIGAKDQVIPGKWYDVRASANYDSKTEKTIVNIALKSSDQSTFGRPNSMTMDGVALQHRVGAWVIGRGYPSGFPNSLSVLEGAIDEVKIQGESMPHQPGMNPLFGDSFTADPAVTIIGNTAYAYVGQDAASVGGWFNMPNWLCYTSTDMKNWKAHGPVLAAKDFQNAAPGAAWAAQVVEKGGKYYYYVTLDGKAGHFITVAVSDNPLGPFKEALPGKPLITDAMTKDSHRANSDIDPTVFIDEDGTPWMAWGNGDCYMVKLKQNMIETEGEIMKVPFRNFSEGPWLFKRKSLYYMVYAADAPGVQAEQIAYSYAKSIKGPWVYGGLLTGSAKFGFTIHPSVVELNKQWYFIYHDGAYMLNGEIGGDCRRQVCVEYLYFNPDGTIKPIALTSKGISKAPKK